MGAAIGLAVSGCLEETAGEQAPRSGGSEGVAATSNPSAVTRADEDLTSSEDVVAASDTPRAPAEERQAFFGDLHIHSSWSFDAFAAGVEAGPDSAYRYARGEPIPYYRDEEIQLEGPPLDFIALTEHAEYLGLSIASSRPDHPIRSQPLIRSWKGDDPELRRLAWQKINKSYSERNVLPALTVDSVVVPAWRALVKLANEQNRPGSFTSFVGFEYSPNPEGQNLHRNVIFRGADAPDRPFSSMESENPEDLWRWMDEVRASKGDLLAIPHNSNGSNGLMFAMTRHDGTPIDAEWILQRARNEPLAEVVQIKGQSETHPALSPDDEWADFEINDWRTTRADLPSQPAGSYLRDALKRGLQIEERLGANPYALGMVGSTDGHNAASPFEERNFSGKIGPRDSTPEARLAWLVPKNPNLEPIVATATRWSAAGLAGIWADANTREALFDAMRRRETFSTTGPRIRVRLFASWEFEPEDAGGNLARAGYARGVPMGGVLPPASAPTDAAAAPTFLVAALKDPLEAELERIQIVKGWLTEGAVHERVFDVACSDGTAPEPKSQRCPARAPDPDRETCEPAASAGAAELAAFWRDPDFDPNTPAFYYVRVLQIPTCRWSTLDAMRLGQPPHSEVPLTIQERAITSPIWIGGASGGASLAPAAAGTSSD